MNEISQNVVGIVSPQTKGRSGSVNRTQEAPAVEASKVTQLPREQKAELPIPQALAGKEIKEAVGNLNDFAQAVNRQLQFSVDKDNDEVVVKVVGAGLCHSDLSVINGARGRALPIALGHEGAGEVVEVGSGVSDVRVGDPVVFQFSASCGRWRSTSSPDDR